jgi:uncharacterized membrane protein
MANAMSSGGSRITSLDALRGTVMVIMALDHVRDFVHAGAMTGSPTDLRTTTVALFITRWITHFCLPVFMFTAGMGMFLWAHRSGRTPWELSRFLVTRGLWFMLLELTVMRFAYDFDFSLQYLWLLLVLWSFGLCMLVMAVLVHIPRRWLAVLSVAAIALHNLLDGVDAARFGAWAWVWNIAHEPGVFMVLGRSALVTYPLLPWAAVMAAGFCFGEVYTLDPARRQSIMLRVGAAMTVAFFVLRAINRYGDPEHWAVQKSAAFTVLSFLNCTKYPGSLDYVLMTLGPALMLLASLDRRPLQGTNPLLIFGRVPMFYFVLHFYLAHAIAVVLALMRYGGAALAFVFNPSPAMGGPAKIYPAGYGFSLWVVYAVWIVVVLSLYPLCRWFARVKATRRDWWLSYL